LIFSTKDRGNTIAREWQPRLWAYLAGICKNHEMIALAVGETENHVHILFHLPPKVALAKAIILLKANSSKWMGDQGKDFFWQVRIRSIQRQFIEPQSGSAIHPESRGASSENQFRGRISRAASEAWRGIRLEIRSWLAMCRPYGAWGYHADAYPPLPRWATIFRP
jgi:REP element-mobilizing transposase RayT